MDGKFGRRFPIAALAWQNLTRQRARSILAMAGITIGVVAIASLGMFGATLEVSIQQTWQDTASTVLVSPGPDLDADQLDEEHVREVERYATGPIYEVRSSEANVTLGGENREWQLQSVSEPTEFTAAAEGRIPTTWRSGALVGNSLADTYDINPGDSLRVENQSVPVAAVLEPDDQVQMVRTENTILLPERQLGAEGIDQLILRAENAQAAQDLAQELDDNLNGRRELYSVNEFSSIIDRINEQLGTIQTFLVGVGAISLLVAAVSILNVMLMSTIERRGEIGVLRAVGYYKRDILRLMLTEALLLGVVGAVVGLLLSVVMGMVINQTLLNDPFAFGGSAGFYAVAGFLFGTGASLVSGFYPAWKAANERPVDALRD